MQRTITDGISTLTPLASTGRKPGPSRVCVIRYVLDATISRNDTSYKKVYTSHAQCPRLYCPCPQPIRRDVSSYSSSLTFSLNRSSSSSSSSTAFSPSCPPSWSTGAIIPSIPLGSGRSIGISSSTAASSDSPASLSLSPKYSSSGSTLERRISSASENQHLTHSGKYDRAI